ncbi:MULTISPECIES: M24 family metallopeptidase [Mammaliicoccus]|uniref:M24 family metallopeptidase n=1 Tax=Mammaliicoccus TaxID=2803850 RepID=UPI00065C0E62|nr:MULTISPECIES: Xaa-Pro peptidase family protein [Mammaliicoccus]MBO1219052.1 aminopeptidase P family protein [Mammaliicoccus sciuri]MBO1232599.1 aminopeptidase P family protein [Mammaliicoccus sciuri]MDQ7129859.1 Xaa-Pro peptidase family protein [Mammaliicoccus sciuri]PNY91861.1 aminopeptidase P family protein [Mammaliicoccus sciuri]PTJ75785.1 aminopeptidase P family protein [Mammaliicoccus sciuri]
MKINKLREVMNEKGLEAVVILSPYNRRYLSGFTGTSGSLLITQDKSLLITDFRYIQQANDQAQDFEVINQEGPMLSKINDLIKEGQYKNVGVESHLITYNEYQALNTDAVELSSIESVIETIRMVKDEFEIKQIQKAADIVDETYEHILKWVKPGMTENEVNNEMEMFMRSKGATCSSFDTIVASGHRGALPHGVASNKVIEEGDMITLDFGALYEGYVSDVTRTFAIGEPKEEMKKIYNIVLEAQLAALEQIKPGMTGKEADTIARDIIKSYGYGEQFGHSLGHGIGLEVHEGPALSQKSDIVLEENMCITLEPGIYVDGLGGVRIEDDVLVTKNGLQRFTKSSKDLIIL